MSNGDHYIDGRWTASTGVDLIDVLNPYTEQRIAETPAGTAADVDKAVAAGRRALPGWSSTTPAERSVWLMAIADLLEANWDRLGELLSSELGAPIGLAALVHVGLPIGTLHTYARMADTFAWDTEAGTSLITREPVGVVGAITPWNYPLHQIVAKVAPALLAGCTMVLKPSEITPLIAHAFAQLVDESGLPAGVFNLVSGTGPVVGEAIAAHPDVDMVSFTGSGPAGRRVAVLAAESVKRVTLELGGKSACVLLDDLSPENFAKAVTASIDQCFANSGQRCSAFSRLLVPQDRYEEALAVAADAANSYVLGDPMLPETTLGPLVSAQQQQRVVGFLDRAVSDGARVVAGGSKLPEHLTTGFFVAPTVLADAAPTSEIAQEEVFGPVVVVLPYADREDAIALANNTRYGLAAGVYGDDPDEVMTVARSLRAGQVEINGGQWNWQAPFGGYGQSGNGRELGAAGLEEYLETKAMQR
jgi:aldehyde dehydrogenase (NAD+)